MDNNQNNDFVTNNTSVVNATVSDGLGNVSTNNVGNNANSNTTTNDFVNNNMSRIIGENNNSGINMGAFNKINTEQTSSSVTAGVSNNSEPLEVASIVSNDNVSNTNSTISSKKQEYTGYKEPSNGRFFMLFLLFGGLLSLIYFLPDISEYLAIVKAEKQAGNTTITTGTLVCDFSNNDENLTYDYQLKFYYTDSKLEELDYTVTTKGDKTLDLDRLQKVYDECLVLSNNTRDLMGVSVSCKLNTSDVIQAQSLDYGVINIDSVTAAYTEAGGLYPEFENGQNIDTIERNMNASGYSCKRVD